MTPSMATREPPLDEVQWQDRQLLYEEMNGLHSNTVLYYFARSPFFDPTSNNAVLFTQASMNQSMHYLLGTREAFEGRLKTMSGLEFMVAQEPAEMAPGTGTGVWVIRKQTRRKRQSEEDEIIVHSTYFVVEPNIYMAPALSDVLGSRILTTLSSLNKFISTASTLPSFSPALGHVYMPLATPNRNQPIESQVTQVFKDDVPLPGLIQPPKTSLPISKSSTLLSNRLLEESLDISLKYGDEYMDEIPITGQPGSFIFSTTGRKNEKAAVPLLDKGPDATTSAKPTPPTPLKTDVPPARKGSTKSPKTPGMPKPKRRKTKPLTSGGVSPK